MTHADPVLTPTDPADPKNIVIIILTFIFIALYSATIFGFVKLPADDKLLGRLEPIIAVIIGYYFGRMPSEKNEKSLKQQVDKKTQEADDARKGETEAKTQSTEAQTKIKDARAALSSAAPAAEPSELAVTLSGAHASAAPEPAVRNAAVAALKILET
jgi:hypothetical protein